MMTAVAWELRRRNVNSGAADPARVLQTKKTTSMKTENSRDAVRVDFHNADADGYVRLSNKGAIEDIARLGLTLVDGQGLHLTDGEVVVFGVARAPGSEGVWRAQVDWPDVFRRHAGLK
jgi:hypothetical protein